MRAEVQEVAGQKFQKHRQQFTTTEHLFSQHHTDPTASSKCDHSHSHTHTSAHSAPHPHKPHTHPHSHLLIHSHPAHTHAHTTTSTQPPPCTHKHTPAHKAGLHLSHSNGSPATPHPDGKSQPAWSQAHLHPSQREPSQLLQPPNPVFITTACLPASL